MAPFAPIAETELHPSQLRPSVLQPRRIPPSDQADASAAPTWFELRQEDLPLWNDVLRGTDISLYQYPYWNEPYRPLYLTPRYLAWGTQDRPLAYVCILTIGMRPAQIGLVFRGPTSLQAGMDIPHDAMSQLVDWARAQGYAFIRFTHSDENVLNRLASVSDARDVDVFPFFLDYPVLSPDYVVEQRASDRDTLAGFDREARRKLRRATEIGYKVRSEESPDALARLWPLYQECARRKHFRLERPLAVYMDAIRRARPHDSVRVYSVYFKGKPVGSTLVFRDRDSAHCLLAAFDVEHRQSAVFLHWESMRDMYRLGAKRYNLGPGPGLLARFKQQFSQHPVTYPAARTVVLNERLFTLWSKVVFPVAKRLRPMLREIVSRLRS
jgi:hypothetical protein